MEFNQLVKERRSIFKFCNRLVVVDDILPLIEAAIYAPNHHLTQPWRFIYVGKAHQQRLAFDYAQAKAFKAMAADRQVSDRIRQQAMDKFMAIPALLLVSCRLDKQLIVQEEDIAATYCAIQNILLAATNQGLGAQWSTHDIIKDAESMQQVGIDLTKERCLAMIYLGYPEVIPPVTNRKCVDDVLTCLT